MTIIIGRLGQDPELKESNGTKWLRLSVAVSKTWKDSSGTKKEKTYWFPVVAYKGTAEYIANNAKKGSEVYVKGEMSYNEKDGKTYWNLNAQNISILSGWKNESGGGHAAKDTDDDGFIPEV